MCCDLWHRHRCTASKSKPMELGTRQTKQNKFNMNIDACIFEIYIFLFGLPETEIFVCIIAWWPDSYSNICARGVKNAQNSCRSYISLYLVYTCLSPSDFNTWCTILYVFIHTFLHNLVCSWAYLKSLQEVLLYPYYRILLMLMSSSNSPYTRSFTSLGLSLFFRLESRHKKLYR